MANNCKSNWSYIQSLKDYKKFVEFIDLNCLQNFVTNMRPDDFVEYHVVIPTNKNLDNVEGSDIDKKIKFLKSHIFRKKCNGSVYPYSSPFSDIDIGDGEIKGKFRNKEETLFKIEKLSEKDKGLVLYKDVSSSNNTFLEGVIEKEVTGGFSEMESLENTSIQSDEGQLVTGGGNNRHQFFIKVGSIMKSNYEDTRVLMMYNLMSMSKRSNNKDTNPWLLYCVSLYNWLSVEESKTLDVILPITDVHPGVTMAITLLDPMSPVTNEMLSRWGMGIMSTNAAEEWENFLSRVVIKPQRTEDKQMSILRKIEKEKLTSDLPTIAVNMYKTCEYQNYYPKDTVERFFSGPDGVYRKMWQDQVRCLITCSFVNSCDVSLVADNSKLEINDLRAHSADYRNNIFTTDTFIGNHALHHAFIRWFKSTDLLYLPTSLDSKITTYVSSTVTTNTNKFKSNEVLNMYNVRRSLVKQMKSKDNTKIMTKYMKNRMSNDVTGENMNVDNVDSIDIDITNDNAIPDYTF